MLTPISEVGKSRVEGEAMGSQCVSCAGSGCGKCTRCNEEIRKRYVCRHPDFPRHKGEKRIDYDPENPMEPVFGTAFVTLVVLVLFFLVYYGVQFVRWLF